jgi:hypothetical protein
VLLSLHRRFLKRMRSLAERHRPPKWIPPALRRLVRVSTRGLHRYYHLRLARGALAGRTANLDDVAAFVSEHPVRLNQPLVLISQVQRSGGSLLGQLFDGHPALAAYPHELKFGFSPPDRWPPVDPALGAARNFRALFDLNFPRHVRRGFTKGDRNPIRHRFLLIPRVQYALFKRLWQEAPPAGRRGVLDHYFTAFFNGWLNYQGALERKRWITAFAPRLAHDEPSVRRFFEDYPDGRLIQIIRDPGGWYPSARKHKQSKLAGRDPDFVIGKWRETAESMLRNRGRYGDRVVILRFDDLVSRTEETMRALSRTLGIDYDPVLREPTFNGQPMRANSSFDVQRAGVISAPLTREKMLSQEERALIEKRCGALYAEVAAAGLAVSAGAKANRVA